LFISSLANASLCVFSYLPVLTVMWQKYQVSQVSASLRGLPVFIPAFFQLAESHHQHSATATLALANQLPLPRLQSALFWFYRVSSAV